MYRDEGEIKTGAQGPICRPPPKCKLKKELKVEINYVIMPTFFVILSICQSASLHFEIELMYATNDCVLPQIHPSINQLIN